jgi:hypothetical protein
MAKNQKAYIYMYTYRTQVQDITIALVFMSAWHMPAFPQEG